MSEPTYGEDDYEDYEIQIECQYCNGDGWIESGDGLRIPCEECGGTGWE